MDITIPSKLSNLLNGLTDEISAAVGNVLASVSPILKRNESPFFPDYTDHGLEHVNNVLRTCELIISEDAWSIFTREDAATLILATVAHDLGMLLSIEGFRSLVDSNSQGNQPTDPKDEPWHILWRKFQLDARRFDGATMISLLGSPDPVAIQELNPHHFTERGLKIAGEFLRRHHHRLAHEIVLHGMPSENGFISLFNKSPQHLTDTAGLIARSHGVSVRTCLETLTKIDSTRHREYRHIHPTFLMALVRLADYLDLDHGRAPISVLTAKSLTSPISRREWWAHRSLVDCHSLADDPECLHVVVEPTELPNVETFLNIENKIEGIQQELDSCWAVIGEVYGRFPPLNRLSLKIRRIRSDIRKPSITEKLPFVPHRASLESSKSELLKLLIAPLYGDTPSIGIRELLQNSIDAVREFEFTLKESPNLRSRNQNGNDEDITVYFEKNNENDIWVVVKDCGIGMTWETVCKYYLTAGASFRKSDVWRQKFTDDSGKTQILRSGRFGIGILAAFLLGGRVQVHTRHVDEPEERGIFFEFGLDDTTIEMKWMKREVGTTIKVKTDQKTVKELMVRKYSNELAGDLWDWFCLKKPVVVRKNIDGKILRQRFKLPEPLGELPFHQFSIKVPGYQEVHWSYNQRIPSLVCNGILIADSYTYIPIRQEFIRNKDRSNISKPTDVFTHLSNYEFISLAPPKVSVFDPDGRLPLNLARNDLASIPHDLASAITDDVCRNFIAFCLLKGPKTRLLSSNQLSTYNILRYPGGGHKKRYTSHLLFDTPDGFGICDPWNLSHFFPEVWLLVRSKESEIVLPHELTEFAHTKYKVIIGNASDGGLGEFDSWQRKLALYDQEKECLPVLKHFDGLKGIKTLMPTKWHERFIEKQPRFIKSEVTEQYKTSNWAIWSKGNTLDSNDTLVSLANIIQEYDLPIESITECFFWPNTKIQTPGRISQMWRQVIGNPVIPFDPTRRQEIINSLDEQFERHLAEWSRNT